MDSNLTQGVEKLLNPIRTNLIKKLLEAKISYSNKFEDHKLDDIKIPEKFMISINNGNMNPEFNIFDWNPEDIAKQMTLIGINHHSK
jgi:hypothetical protein